MAVDPLDQSSDRHLTVTMNEIKILVGMMTKLIMDCFIHSS